MKPQTETALVRLILDYLQLTGILAWRSNNTGVYDPSRKRFRTFHGRKGVADILAVIDGRLYGFECKAAKGKASPEQLQFLSDLNAAGGVGAIVRSLEDVRRVIAAESTTSEGNP